MQLVKLTSNNSWIEGLVKKHGNIVRLKVNLGDRFLVESLNKTYRNELWSIWLDSEKDATFEAVKD